MAATGQGRASVRVNTSGRGETNVATGVPVLDHLLTLLAQYASFDLALEVEPGDPEVEIRAAARSRMLLPCNSATPRRLVAACVALQSGLVAAAATRPGLERLEHLRILNATQLNRATYEYLASLEWIPFKRNAVLVGPVGIAAHYSSFSTSVGKESNFVAFDFDSQASTLA